MLTKKMKFDEDVLDVLRAMTWSDDGLLGKIVSQLDRGLYMKVNKALDAMGGKWNKKAGGHVFASDPRTNVEGLIASGVLVVERDGFFETPRAVVERMLELAPLSRATQLIMEPSVGRGAILKVLLEQPHSEVHLFQVLEKNEVRRAYIAQTFPDVEIVGTDFLKYQLPRYQDDNEVMCYADRIYMNPPFEELQDIRHVGQYAACEDRKENSMNDATLLTLIGERPTQAPEGWLIFNAPRPLYGQLEWQGDFKHGLFYVAVDPADEFSAGFIFENLRNDAYLLRYASPVEVMEWAKKFAADHQVDLADFEQRDIENSWRNSHPALVRSYDPSLRKITAEQLLALFEAAT